MEADGSMDPAIERMDVQSEADVPADAAPVPDEPSEATEDAELEVAALERGFGGDADRLEQFLAALQPGLPPGTLIGLRGSAVAGRSYQTGEPFDSKGPGSSDLDIVVIGDDVTELWVPEARLLGGINTLPLSDDAPWVAPELDPARRRAQAVVERPVSVQAMAAWFLDLRTQVQGQPYVILAEPT